MPRAHHGTQEALTNGVRGQASKGARFEVQGRIALGVLLYLVRQLSSSSSFCSWREQLRACGGLSTVAGLNLERRCCRWCSDTCLLYERDLGELSSTKSQLLSNRSVHSFKLPYSHSGATPADIHEIGGPSPPDAASWSTMSKRTNAYKPLSVAFRCFSASVGGDCCSRMDEDALCASWLNGDHRPREASDRETRKKQQTV